MSKSKKQKFKIGDRVRYRGVDTKILLCLPDSNAGRDYFLESRAYASEDALTPLAPFPIAINTFSSLHQKQFRGTDIAVLLLVVIPFATVIFLVPSFLLCMTGRVDFGTVLEYFPIIYMIVGLGIGSAFWASRILTVGFRDFTYLPSSIHSMLDRGKKILK